MSTGPIDMQLFSDVAVDDLDLKPKLRQSGVTVSSVDDPKKYQAQYYQKYKLRWRESYLARQEEILARNKTEPCRARRRAYCKKYHKTHHDLCYALERRWKKENRERTAFLNRLSYLRVSRAKGVGPKVRLPKEEKRRRANAYEKRRYKENPHAYIARCLRANLRHALQRKGASKCTRFMDSLGCSIEMFVRHIESRFEGWMTWENRSRWHLDHLIPISAFNLHDPEEQKWANYFQNIQPMEKFKNQSKQDTLPASLPTWLPPHIAQRIIDRSAK